MSFPDAIMGQQHDWMGVGWLNPLHAVMYFLRRPSSWNSKRGLKFFLPFPLSVILCVL